MLRNYLKVAFRNLWKERIYTFVNVVGLATGIACCLLIALYARHEWSYDRFHEKADRTYRAWGREDWGDGRTFFHTVTPVPLAEALETHIPEVEETVRIGAYSATVASGNDRFTENVRLVDASFFEVFDFPVLDGRAEDVFSHPNTVVLTTETAAKYFGSENPRGRTLTLDLTGEQQEYIVEGVVAPPPANSSIQFDVLVPFSKAPDLMDEQALTSFFNIFVETYVLVRGETSAAEAKLPGMLSAILGDMAERSGYQIGFQSMTDIHLNPDYPAGIAPVSDPAYSYFLVGIAVLVLLIASINFVTLSIGQSARRGGEVGVRKALGAGRVQLIRQFWGEAVLVVGLAVLFGLLVAWAARPLFNDIAGVALPVSLNVGTLAALAALVLVVGTLAGAYPAFVLSSFKPVEALRGKLRVAGDRSVLRKGLVVAQFSISILLIVGTLFVLKQLDYLRDKDLGFEREDVVVVRTGQGGGEQVVDRMRAALSGYSSIESVASSAFAMNDGWAQLGFDLDDGAYAGFAANAISPEFLSTMSIDVVGGRAFALDRTADSRAIVVNEAFVREFGFESPQDALGERLPSDAYEDHQIVGVVADFNFESLHTTVRPLVLSRSLSWLFEGSNDVQLRSPPTPDITIRIDTGDLASTMDLVEKAWASVGEGRPFDFVFLDEALDNRYRQEEQLGRIVATGATLAILIACMGVFGLAALTVVRRRKEIGVRKVLGATVTNIVVLLARDFAVLVGVAFLLAAPPAYMLVDRWLDSFAFRIDVSSGTFIAAGLLALLLALVAVSYQSVRAALTDPVRSLRYE